MTRAWHCQYIHTQDHYSVLQIMPWIRRETYYSVEKYMYGEVMGNGTKLLPMGMDHTDNMCLQNYVVRYSFFKCTGPSIIICCGTMPQLQPYMYLSFTKNQIRSFSLGERSLLLSTCTIQSVYTIYMYHQSCAQHSHGKITIKRN